MVRRTSAVCLLALAACGDGIAVPDAAIAQDGSTRGRVSVHTNGSGVRVFFQAADSSLVLATRTNAAGDAAALVEPGGFVTVFDGGQLFTWTDVQVGDELVLAPPTFSSPTEFFPDLQIQVFTYPEATSYFLYVPCDFRRDVTAATFDLIAPGFSTCSTRVDTLLIASNSTQLAFEYRQNVNLSIAGPIRFGTNYAPMELQTVDITSSPELTGVSVQSTIDQVPYGVARAAAPAGDHLTAQLEMPRGPFTVRTIATASQFPINEDAMLPSTVRGVVWGPYASDVAIDLSLREIVEPMTIDPTSYRVTWTESTTGAVPDVVVLALQTRNGTPWQVIARHSDEGVRLPVLPQDDLQLAEASQVSTYTLLAIDGGYDRVRATLLGQWQPGDPHLPGASGRAVYRTPF